MFALFKILIKYYNSHSIECKTNCFKDMKGFGDVKLCTITFWINLFIKKTKINGKENTNLEVPHYLRLWRDVIDWFYEHI